jgi:hypothetical protein
MTSEGQAQLVCPRCAQQLPDYARTCHRCGLRLDPGVAYFPTEPDTDDAPAAPDATPGAPLPVYERKRVSCLPMDVERIARAEAVDGWALLDTTVDPDVPGSIIAHFQRPQRPAARGVVGAPAAAPAQPAARQGAPSTTAPNRQSERRAAVPRAERQPVAQPEAPDGAAERDPREIIYVVLLVIAFIVLIKQLEIFGLLIALFVLPGVLRGLLGLPDRKRRRRR